MRLNQQHGEPELDPGMSKIRLRAIAQIGKIPRELEKAKPAKGHGHEVPAGGKFKEQQLAEAGISTSAGGYEQLAAQIKPSLDRRFGGVSQERLKGFCLPWVCREDRASMKGLRNACRTGISRQLTLLK